MLDSKFAPIILHALFERVVNDKSSKIRDF